MMQILSVEQLQTVADLLPPPQPAATNGKAGNDDFEHRLDIPRWLASRGVGFRPKERPDQFGRAVYLLDECPFDASHGKSKEVAIFQDVAGKLAASCKHNSCQGRGWQDFKDKIGKPDDDHYEPPLIRNHSRNGSAYKQSAGNEPFLWEPNIVTMNKIEPRAVEWLWKNRIPNGKLVSLSGNPGLGKTLVLMDIAARVSRGSDWPDGEPGDRQPGGVVICSAEDDPHDTLRPRLDAAGADVSRINLVQSVVLMDGKSKKKSERLIDLQQDRDVIGKAMDLTDNCKLLIMDPINAYLGKTDSHKNAEVRQILGPIAELCHRKGVAFIYLGHLNKSNNGPAMYRAAGSIAFVAAARVAYMVVESKEDPSIRLFLPVKNNLAPNIGGLSFQVVAVNDLPRIEWSDIPVTTSADEALATDARGARGNLERDKDWLREQLAGGPMESEQLIEQGKAAGISRNRLFKAKEASGVAARKNGFGGGAPWEWFVP